MLSYQHSYHAGCFADVLKHTILVQLLQYLIQKDKPLLYLETHSGRGFYHLKDAHALKTMEYKTGIELLWQQRKHLPPVFNDYLQLLRTLNSSQTLQYYPGSPRIALDLLREQDRLVLCELHPQEFKILTELPKKGRRVYFSQNDGIAQLRAYLPPPERRALIFIDPSYEIKMEYRHIPQALQSAYQRFPTGVYALWYPLIDAQLNDALRRGMSKISAPALQIELTLNTNENKGMKGCGMWIINPPYVLQEQANSMLLSLKDVFKSSVYIKSYP